MAAKIALLCLLAILVALPIEAHNYKKAVVAGASTSACPSSPLDKCDFYFDSMKSSIPTFNLKRRAGDYTLSGNKLKYSVNGYDGVVEVDSSGMAKYIGCNGRVPNQFYLNGHPASFLKARSFNSGIANFRNCCVILKIDHFFVNVGGKKYNVRPGDNNAKFPESRRCVVFNTF